MPKVINWKDIPMEQLNERIGRKIVTGDKAMVAHVYLKKGAVVPEHSHENEQITYILEGEIKFLIGEEKQEVTMGAGDVMVIPANVAHSAQAIEDTLDVDIFSPPRQDWLSGSDSYLRQK